ncbi:hypothetical protein ERO13_A12G134051v2 [Gossypium hirsutum]|nr:hypothetical protein ERO13_A12G134051v2 [Gossypium hirsutum]
MELPARDSILLEDFGQKVDLTRRIREVLLNYPEGTTVLKELIQNADDAGATKVRLCLDRRSHGTDSLLSDSLGQWQGPSLLAYNDAVFTEEDFVSISRIGGSGKHGQAWKTGRFGVGFNSVYHLTDLPSFVSGKYVVLFDPQGFYLPNVSTANPGKRIDFVSSSALSIYNDQFLPYRVFGCDMKSSFAGTLFRFPLRNSDQAGRSKLSRQAYSEDDISSLFFQLFEEGVFSLLFLKSVLCIEMYTWDAGESEPKKLFSCSVNSPSDEIIWHRQALLRLSKPVVNSTGNEVDAYSVEFLSEAMAGTECRKRIDTFYIVQSMASASSRIGSFAATASKEYDIHLLPWASVAACISDSSSDNAALKLGQAFCFLPLPVRTGLTVQVNAYFEVSSNRRGIWYGEDMDRSGKVRSIWNRLLLEDVIAPIFMQMLLGVRELLGPTNSYYSLWPKGSFEEPWSILVENIYKNISNSAVLYSDLGGGKWVSPVEAFLHDGEFGKSKELAEALLQLGMPIVHLPSYLFDMFLKYATDFQQKVVTPDTVRHFLRSCKTLMSLSKSFKLVLLEYCLEDLIDSDVGAYANNLSLIPLANGDFGIFSEGTKGVSYFVCNELEYMLLQQISDIIVDRDIPLNLLSRLSAIAKSSKANLAVFSVQHFVKLFPRFAPAEWRYKSKVLWEPESSCTFPTKSWFVLFWQYLQNQGEGLLLFGDWPILPSTSGHLYRPSRQSKLIKAEKLSDRMQGILVKIGCKILDPDYGVAHPDLFHYVSDSTFSGVLDSIFDIASSNGNIIQTFNCNLTAEEKNELREFLLYPKWYLGELINSSRIKNCKKLPIYRVHTAESAQNFCFSDLENPQKYLPPFGIPEYLLGGEFILCSSNSEEEILLRFYEVERMGKARFYRQQVLNRIKEMHNEVRDSVMLSVLENLPQLSIEDTSLRDYLRNLEFVPTSTGALKCPSVLYDPRNEELYALLEDSDSFPSGPFQESGILDMLQGLGLRTSVTPETVIESAQQIERMMHEDQHKAHSRGKILLSYLEVNAMKWLPNQVSDDQGAVNRIFSRAATAFRPRNMRSDLEKFWSDLRMICWCPVLVSSPFQALPWPVVSSKVAPPKIVRLQTDLWLISASMRILDGECSSTALSYNLGWLTPPGGSAIAAQLLELGKNNEIVNEQVLRQELALAMPRIYSILMNMIGADEMDIVKAVLEGCRWIWVGDGFATSDEVVLDGPLHLTPYIRVIPMDLAVFKELFLELGIREFLKPSDYANILGRMAARKGSSPLDADEIRAAILIVQHLSGVQFHEEVKIYLPDASARLHPASDLVYNDAPWFLGSDDSDTLFSGRSAAVLNARSTQRFVHGNISNEVAEKLGVCSLRRILLAESADSMNLSLSGAAEAFGQHEALTTRLKHILEMYADGPGILFELVQNAEDSGASEVTFLLDKTQYGTSSILSPEMADWQGPALYCFNDSVFSPQDLYAISRIGQESKLEKPFAIGRFGLGFNCVYHFTDIPTFVSGENIVMFDPHASNLPGISPSHPGLRIKFVGRKVLEQFPDQFSPFLYFGCDLQQFFPGTLFRFPLRSSSSISIFVKEGAGHEMQLMHRVQRNCISEPQMHSDALHQTFGLIDAKRHGGMDKDQLLKKLSKCIDRELPHKCQKIVVTEQNSSGVVSHCWITVECLGSGRAKTNHSVADDKIHKSIPWACVAAHIQSVKVDAEICDVFSRENTCAGDIFQLSMASVQDRKNIEGRAFCFLPLPISTGLPTHINAYFELSSNRRDIWFGNDMAGGGKKRSDWNIYLLEDVVAPAYGQLLEKIASLVGPSEFFFSFWPTTGGLEPWASVVRKLYSFIAEFGLRVLYTKARGGQWISTKQTIFPDFTFHKAHELVEALCDAGLPVAKVPKPVVERFIDVCPSLHYLTPQFLRSRLSRRKRGLKDRNAVILTLEYCLLDLKIPVQADCLFGLPLLPLADESVTTFEKNGAGERIYIARGDEYGLLKDLLPQQLVYCELLEVVHSKLCDMAQSEQSNLSFLSCHLLEKLFLKLLPADWQLAKNVSWVPGHEGHPSLEWIKLLWSYLNSCCDDLSIFFKWPILPVEDNYLLQLVKSSNVIKNDGWSENMSTLLLKVGCLFLRQDMGIQHPQLELFVQSPTASGILNAFLAVAGNGKMESIEGLFADASEGELHELRSYILQSKWFHEEQMTDLHIDIIKHIPMFESYRSRKLVSLKKPVKWLKPNGIREDMLNDDLCPSKVEFYKSYVLNHMSEFLSQQGAFPAILHDVKMLVEEDISIRSALSTTPFVLAANGSWQPPSRLYDPRVPELQKLLCKDVFFPSEKFSDPETLDTLVSLGLRRTLGFIGFLDCARSISTLHESGDPEAATYGKKLLLYIDALACKLSSVREGDAQKAISNKLPENYPASEGNGSEMPGDLIDLNSDVVCEDFWSEMKTIAWCPVCVNPPFQGLPWLKPTSHLVSSSTVRPKSQMWMVSSTMHILDGQCDSLYIQQRLGWMDQLNINVLSTQLIELSKSYCNLKSHSLVEPDFDAAMQQGIPMLYSKLQEHIGTDDFMVLKYSLDGVSWVWIGDDFVSPNALAFDSPVKFTPYLYVVPSELAEFRDLLLELGVRLSFDIWDYFHVLQRLQNDLKGLSLSADQFGFVNCVLEAIADCSSDKPFFEASNSPLLIPDSCGVLVSAGELVYNDAPWIENSDLVGKRFIHPSINNDLANRLGVKSLRCLSLVSEDMTKDLPCMEFARISELLSLYGNNEFLLFDLLELADCCKAKNLHLIFDKREHPRQSLLQHNLVEFQGPALVAILEGASLNREEISGLQLIPPWRLRANTLNYGLGLLSCYFICDLLSIISGGYFYMFDPRGVALSASSSQAPAAKMFSLIGTSLSERFRDQFIPMLIDQKMPWSSSDSTIIRMPLSPECLKDGLELGLNRVNKIIDRFLEQASRILISLKSVLQVSFSTWEEGSTQLCQDYAWRKFQISRLFSSSNAAVKLHVIDVNLFQKGTRFVDRWLVVLSLGSGQTRNMALDRRYLAYNLTPVAGVAAHISRNGHPTNGHHTSSIMTPLPLSGVVTLPVTVLGCFLVRHNGGRYLFKYQIVKDFMRMVVEMQKLRRDPSTSSIDSSSSQAVALSLKAYGDQIYSFWPRSNGYVPSDGADDDSKVSSAEVLKADWECLVEQVIRPFYTRLVDLPVWQLYSGNLVKADEGMFLSQPGNGVGGNLLPATVCSFVKEHYQVFSVPWELVNEIHSVGITVREIKPKMVRELLKAPSTSIVLRSVDTFVDVLEYCLVTNEVGIGLDSVSVSNARTYQGSSQNAAISGDALEMVTNLGKALFDFGRGVVEDIGRAGTLGQRDDGAGSSNSRNARLGVTELWLGNKEHQMLMRPLAAKFVHSKIAFHDNWVNHVMESNLAPWFSWRICQNLWKSFGQSSDDLSLFSDWPLIPAYLGRPILCRVRDCHLVFIPPPTDPISGNGVMDAAATQHDLTGVSVDQTSESDSIHPSLGQVIASKLVATKHELLNLFALDFSNNGPRYGRDELEVLCSLPIYRTVLGSFTGLNNQEHCMISSNSFLKPCNEHCLSKTQNEREDILIYLYTNWQDLQADSSVVEALRETSFPKDLFDPGDALLASVFSGERKKFPGERFSTEGWLRILRKVEFLGSECMKSTGDFDDFETDMTRCRGEVSMEVWTLAGSVIEAVLTNFAVLYGNNFSELGLPNVGVKRVLASYGEAILLKTGLWLGAVLLFSLGKMLFLLNILGSTALEESSVLATVLKHLQIIGKNGGEDTLAHWPTASGMMTIDDATYEVLKYLDKIWGSLLLQLPSLYLPFMKILKDLGLQDMLSVASAKELLLNLQKACGYQRLNPNELRLLDWKSDAVLPDDGCRLVHAKTCIYIDSYGCRFVKHIHTSRLRFVHPNIPERICRVLGIKKLSEVVTEKLDNEGNLETLDGIGSIPLDIIREKLLSRSFQGAVWTLVNSIAGYLPGINNLDLGTIHSSLESIADKLQFVKCLHTRFWLLSRSQDITFVSKDSVIPEWENESRHRTLYFVDKSKGCILVAEPPTYISVLDVVATVVSQVLGSPIPLPIGSLFSCPEGSEAAIIDILKLHSDKREEIETTSNNLIGKEIMPQDALQVQLHPLRPFYRGEIVAWRTQDGEKLKYGRVPEDVRPSAGQALYRSRFSHLEVYHGKQCSSAVLPEDNPVITDNRTHNEMPESSERGRTKFSQPIKELQYGRVSAAELVQAVNEMLSAAGINMDVKKQSLLQQTITLQEQLKESRTALLLEQEKLDIAVKEADTAKAAWLCRVCLSNEVDMTIAPCGHVLCHRCSSAVSRCPFCRLEVKKRSEFTGHDDLKVL